MTKINYQHILWLLCIIIIIQAVFLSFRIEKLVKNSPANLRAEKEEQISNKLKQMPEVSIQQKLPEGGRLSLIPENLQTGGQFELFVYLSASEPIKHIDINIFYDPQYLSAVSPEWQTDESLGTASWSQDVDGISGQQQIAQISFIPIKSGQTKVRLDFTKASTLDCNLINTQGKDILEAIENSQVEIKLVNQ